MGKMQVESQSREIDMFSTVSTARMLLACKRWCNVREHRAEVGVEQGGRIGVWLE